ncbi:MAG: STAS domain-containing protein [Planctomycetes bacterium]|nr:STAS domain-containing protein [Planctomycetota bacterium]
MKELQIKVQNNNDGSANISIHGMVDAYSYGQLEQAFNNLINQGIYNFVVDLSNVDYLSSAGAGIFIGTLGIVQENKGSIKLVDPRPKVRETFNLLGLSQFFDITGNK